MGQSGDGYNLALTLRKYDLRKGDLFIMIWASVRRVRRGSISSEMLMYIAYIYLYLLCNDSC